jgi:ATP-binding cassette subfamily F protein 3
MTQLAVSGASVEFGATTLFTDITFTVGKGDRWGIIGRNGTGKTTLFKMITGAQNPTRGQVTRIGGLRISMLEQHRTFGDAKTVWEAAAGPFSELLALERSLTEQTDALGAAGDAVTEQMLAKYSKDLERFEQEGGYTFAPRIDAVLHGLGFDPAKAREQTLASLSGGERGRVGLARQLVAPVDVLLLDEPTNHLDLETTRWLEEYLRTADVTVLLISHDRAFLDAVVDHVLHLEADTAFAYVGGFASFATQRAERRLTQERAAAKQAKKIASEEDYIRRNLAGQNTRQAKGRRKLLARLPRLSAPGGAEGTMSLRLESGERGGDQVVVADRVQIAIGERVLLENFTVRVGRGDVIGFVGPNGAGKSTLLKSIVGDRPVQGGELRVGGSIQVAYYHQELEQVPLDKTLYDIINDLRPTWTRGQIQGHLGRFGFSGEEVQRMPRTLSGGERSRVALAMIMLSRANLLIFDEPTNHLDVESIEALEDAIDEYDGTVILVSHDRALLRALATRVWVLHDRHITDFPGTFAEWEAVSKERAHAASVAAAEEESLRRVHEKQKTQRKETVTERERSSSRQARRALADAEAAVERLEARVAELTTTLGDPDLYLTPEGTRRAQGLGKDLDRAKAELDAALAKWAEATEAAEGVK